MDDYNIITIKDFRGGLSNEARRGTSGAFYGGYGLNIRGGDNTLKISQAMKLDGGVTFTDLPLAGFHLQGSLYGTYGFAFGSSGKIYRRSTGPAGTWSVAYTDADGKISGAAEFVFKTTYNIAFVSNPSDGSNQVIEGVTYRFKNTMAQIYDIKIGASASDTIDNLIAAINGDTGAGTKYYTGTPTKPTTTALAGSGDSLDVTAYVSHIVWATQTKLKCIKSSNAKSGTWSGSDITLLAYFASGSGVYPHTMKVAAGSLMIADDQYLCMLDYEGAVSYDALNLATGNNANTLSERNDSVIIGTSGIEGNIMTWNGFEDSWILKRPAHSSTINMMIPFENGMLLQTGSSGDLQYWNYSDVSPIMKIMNNGITAGLVLYPGAVCEYKGIPHFGVYGGIVRNGIYSLGRINKNDPIALNLEYVMSRGTPAPIFIGCMWTEGVYLYASWEYSTTSTTYGIDVIDYSNKTTYGVYESLKIDAGMPETVKVVRHVKIVCKTAIPTGCRVTPKIKASNDSDWVELDTEEGATYMTAGDRVKVFNCENSGEVFALQLTLTASGDSTPEVESATIFFQPDNTL